MPSSFTADTILTSPFCFLFSLPVPVGYPGPAFRLLLAGAGRDDDCVQCGWKPNGTAVMPRNAALISGNYKVVIGTQWGFGVYVSFPSGRTSPSAAPALALHRTALSAKAFGPSPVGAYMCVRSQLPDTASY